MQHKLKPGGHPIHPMLVNYPLGLLTITPIFDIVHWITGNGYWSTVAFWMIAAGTLGGLLAAVTGTIDWVAIPAGTRAKTVGLVHGAGNYLILLERAGEPARHCLCVVLPRCCSFHDNRLSRWRTHPALWRRHRAWRKRQRFQPVFKVISRSEQSSKRRTCYELMPAARGGEPGENREAGRIQKR